MVTHTDFKDPTGSRPKKIAGRDQSMVESDRRREKYCQFSLSGTTQQESTSQHHNQEASRLKVISSGEDIGILYTRA